MSTEILINAEGLQRFYGDHCVVDDLNLQLKKGEVLGLLGPNGAGKSTTMQMLTGNLSPTEGEIKINNIDLLDSPKQAKQHLGYLPEQPPVYKDMTVNEYLRYSARLHGVTKADIKEAVENAKARCNLAEVENRLIGNLSKGFQQRVGIAQAILHNPAVIILDEPTVGLDPIQIQEIRSLIRELGKDHSVILSTHILPEVQAVCDRVQIIHQGKTVFNDSLDDLTKTQSQNVLCAGFTHEIDEQVLSSLEGVLSVEKQNHHRYQIQHSGKHNLAQQICQLAQEQQWEITELSPQTATLEQIFMNLVHGEEKAA